MADITQFTNHLTGHTPSRTGNLGCQSGLYNIKAFYQSCKAYLYRQQNYYDEKQVEERIPTAIISLCKSCILNPLPTNVASWTVHMPIGTYMGDSILGVVHTYFSTWFLLLLAVSYGW